MCAVWGCGRPTAAPAERPAPPAVSVECPVCHQWTHPDWLRDGCPYHGHWQAVDPTPRVVTLGTLGRGRVWPARGEAATAELRAGVPPAAWVTTDPDRPLCAPAPLALHTMGSAARVVEVPGLLAIHAHSAGIVVVYAGVNCLVVNSDTGAVVCLVRRGQPPGARHAWPWAPGASRATLRLRLDVAGDAPPGSLTRCQWLQRTAVTAAAPPADLVATRATLFRTTAALLPAYQRAQRALAATPTPRDAPWPTACPVIVRHQLTLPDHTSATWAAVAPMDTFDVPLVHSPDATTRGTPIDARVVCVVCRAVLATAETWVRTCAGVPRKTRPPVSNDVRVLMYRQPAMGKGLPPAVSWRRFRVRLGQGLDASTMRFVRAQLDDNDVCWLLADDRGDTATLVCNRGSARFSPGSPALITGPEPHVADAWGIDARTRLIAAIPSDHRSVFDRSARRVVESDNPLAVLANVQLPHTADTPGLQLAWKPHVSLTVALNRQFS